MCHAALSIQISTAAGGRNSRSTSSHSKSTVKYSLLLLVTLGASDIHSCLLAGPFRTRKNLADIKKLFAEIVVKIVTDKVSVQKMPLAKVTSAGRRLQQSSPRHDPCAWACTALLPMQLLTVLSMIRRFSLRYHPAFFFWLLPPQQLEPGQVEAPFRVQALRVHAQCLAEWPPQVPSVPKT